jgi:hypothetical protein
VDRQSIRQRKETSIARNRAQDCNTPRFQPNLLQTTRCSAPQTAARTRHEPLFRPTPLGAKAMALAFRTNSYSGENPCQFRSSHTIRQWCASQG